MSRHLTLGPGSEFDAVRDLLARWGPSAIGIGDDGAVLDVPAGSRLVVSTDSTVEEVHFKAAWLTPEEIGWRATTAALSDLAAMGAAPLGVLLALTVPARWRGSLGALAEGIGAAVSAQGAPIVGGDVTDGDRLALAITVLGHSRRPLSRAGARAGDTLYVTGALGGPGSALAAWMSGQVPGAAARARFAHPEARIAAGQWLAAHGATAAIDLSDGLAGDVAHIAHASGVRCLLTLDTVPCMEGVGISEAIVSGEEYELLVAAPAIDVRAFAAAHGGLALTAIGEVRAPAPGDGADVVAEQGGARVTLPRAHDHFAEAR
ncbi:MAG: thiamine-phosphate kinase [Gemmatimonadetes bacterium]|nr:thiamine-phosphate kinase [Gemmatimonadota bacterium]